MNTRVVTPKVAEVMEPALPEEKSGSVGVILVDAEQGPNHGRVVVLTLVEGGPAERDGRIHPGDLIYSVNGRNVRDWGVESIRTLVHGRVGTVALLGFERPSTQTKYSVAIRRTRPLAAVESHEHDLERQLEQTQAELRKETTAHHIAEHRVEDEERELSRLRAQLATSRREKDKLVETHAHEMGDVLEEVFVLEDKIRAARDEAKAERSQRTDAEAEVSRVQRQLQDTRRSLEAELRSARDEVDSERALRAEAERDAEHSRQQMQHNRWNPNTNLHGVQI
mmetsp:Transcript_26692/g.61482  ORF Transcript_26692/g.61482 Transcript_26692/m.61482 type:complete len:281 (+) Transcript_26692:65-907(+)